MISFAQAGQRFHYRAGAVVVVDGHVLLHRLEGDTFWALPGGRVEMGELAQAALEREFQEELGTSVTVGELLSTGENFFAWGGQRRQADPHSTTLNGSGRGDNETLSPAESTAWPTPRNSSTSWTSSSTLPTSWPKGARAAR